MKNLKIQLFNNVTVTFDPDDSMCIADTHGNRWNGEYDTEFVWIDFDSGVKRDISILRVPDEAFSDDSYELNENNLDQIAPNVTAEDIIKIFKDNKQYFLECYSNILNNPEKNGEC